MIPLTDKFRRNYSEIFKRTYDKLYNLPTSTEPPIVEELKEAYKSFVDEEYIQPITKFDLFLTYVTNDVVEDEFRHSPLIDQLSRYSIDLDTLKEADFCNSKSIVENIYVTTVHKAKGLEFDNVIVFDAADGGTRVTSTQRRNRMMKMHESSTLQSLGLRKDFTFSSQLSRSTNIIGCINVR